MPGLKTDRQYRSYICGRCKGEILFVEKRPRVCPECGYGWGTRNVRDIPPVVRLNIFGTFTQSGSRGKTEQTTISSR